MNTKFERSDTESPMKPATSEREGSYLANETFLMRQQQRAEEQQGQSRLAKVHVKEHEEPRQATSPQGELQNDIKEHPNLKTQLHAGVPPNENPIPAWNTEAKTDFENALREQQLQYQAKLQARLGLSPKGTAPEFKP